MVRLYVIDLPDADAGQPQDRIGSQVRQSGLIDGGGTATEQIATENVDLTVTGQWRYGRRFSKKAARELEGLAASGYEAIPLFDVTSDELGRKSAYYEIESVDVSPAHADDGGESAFEFVIGLNDAGTRETNFRAIRTRVDDIDTGLATGSGGLVGIDAQSRKTRWFDTEQGKEKAEPVATNETQFGSVELYDPTDASFANPTLIYEIDYADDSPDDVRVWDDRNRDKQFVFESGPTVGDDTLVGDETTVGETFAVTQWQHVFNTASEFDGRPVVDNRILRLRFDETAGRIRAFGWDGSDWVERPIDHGDYVLIDADVERIGPSDVDVFCEFEDADDGSIAEAVLSVQRGISDTIVRQPRNGTIPAKLETMLEPIASDQTTDVSPSQTLKARSEVK